VGGLLLGVRRRAVVGAGLAFSPENVEGDELQGRHASLAIDRGPAGHLRIQAVYLPAGDSTADAAARAALYQRLERHLLPADAAGADLVLGHMNAALRDTDRTHALYARDKAHQRAAERLGLRPFEAPGAPPRLRTYHTAAGLVSRIDDVLTTCPEAALQEWRQHTHVVTDTLAGNDTDHDALIVSVPWAALGRAPNPNCRNPPGAAAASGRAA
jgi:hypothetical protein